ncbi:MAG: AAA family ATPase [Nocardioidaceae bacterium]
MRLHELTVTAFGPFAGTERVDFDDLNEAGLFLLTGPTGAGKTSILDAVCFALYGSVPGVRGVKTLKSQHAPLDVAPEVVLDFSIRERRLVIRRSPEWQRPKKKGSGLLTEKANATLVETTSGRDHLLSSRAQEVGHLVGELVGMTASQFVQVAMLPQGEFQKFLRASSDERHGVLQHLFKTDRFTRIEEWVHDHSRGLREQAEQGRTTVQRVLDTIADRAGVELPEELGGDALAAAGRLSVAGKSGPSDGAPHPATAWARQVLTDAEDRLTAGTAARDQSGSALTEARLRLDEGRTTSALLARRAAARDTLRRLAEDETWAAETRATLERDNRAAACLPVVGLLDEALARREAADRGRSAALAALRALDARLLADPCRVEIAAEPVDPVALTEAGSPALTELARSLRERRTRVEALLPRDRQRREAEAASASAERELDAARRERAELAAAAERLPGELADLREKLAAVAATAGRREAIALALDNARRRLAAAAQVPELDAELVRLRHASRDARDAMADARERVQDLADRRLAGIAAELAGRLEDGRPCQVCGSLEHPEPAVPREGAVTEAEQEQAAADYDARAEDYAAAARAVAETERSLDALRRSAEGSSVDTARAEVAGLKAAAAEADRAAADLAPLEDRVVALTDAREEVTARLGALDTRVATLAQAVAGHRAVVADVTAEIVRVVGDAPAALRDVLAGLDGWIEAVEGIAATALTCESAGARVGELTEKAAAVTAEHGFDGPAAVREAALSPTERARLESALAERAEKLSSAQAVLRDTEAEAAEQDAAPDLAAFEQALRAAEQADAEAARGLHHCEEQVAALRQHAERLQRALADWLPVQERYSRADSMSRLVRGMGHDNQLQMRLSAYVLATRLDQVVAAANERLAHMRDQRYLLQRTGRAARKGSQAGLGLEVVDQWTGDARDPATLSGGETFVVSLSLALGLADVVTQEAGGTEIDTLFVDEGFGTLDADTLDDVMDRLDGLRAGGRTVGVVSHVSELRNRIPTQVHVEKRRTGSSVAVRTLAG